jgi:hypothetical protein
MNPVPPGFGQPLALGTPLPKVVTNKQVRFANQPPLPSSQSSQSSQPAIPATGVTTQPGGKRRRRKTTKKRRTSRRHRTRRHR